MLSEAEMQLLTAFVDGELNPGERAAVMRLLNKSPEAREVLRQFQENAHKLKKLPRRKVDPSLVDEVLQAIAASKSRTAPKPAGQARRRRRWMPYLAASLAASLLIAAIGVFAWKLAQPLREPDSNAPLLVQNDAERKHPEPPSTLIPTFVPLAPRKPHPLLGPMTESIVRDFGAPVPEPKVFTASFGELSREKVVRGHFERELEREKAVQFNVTVKSNPLAVDRLRDVLKAYSIKLVTDPVAGKSLKEKNQAKVEYLVFAEDLSANELARLMGELGETFVVSQNNKQRNVESPYQKIAVSPLATEDRHKVAKLLGVDAGAIAPKSASSDKPAPRALRQAVLLPTTPGGAPSKEVRQFVNQRREIPAGTIQVLIKIRQE